MDFSVDQAESGDTTRAVLGRRHFLSLAGVGMVIGGANALRPAGAQAVVSLGETTAAVDSVAEAQQAALTNAWGGYSNGRIPASALLPVVAGVNGSGYLRDDAGRQYLALALAFSRATGQSLVITEGYRDYDTQVTYWNNYQAGRGNLAAYPGTSNHGWGISCDFGSRVNIAGSMEKRWMDANAPIYGWQPTGNGFSQPEPWHFDYAGGYPGAQPSLATHNDPEVVVLRCPEALDVVGAGYIAVLGVRFLRHVQSIDVVNAMQLSGVIYREVDRKTFYSMTEALSIPRSAITTGADYYRP